MIEPYEFQRAAARWMAARRRAYNGSVMGLGKTTEAALAAVYTGAESAFVVGPAIAEQRWLSDWSQLAPGIPMQFMSYNMAVLHPDSLPRMVDTLILDEAHRLKEMKAQRTKLMLGKNGLLHRSQRVWLLSGTPAPNDRSEWWVPLSTVWPERLQAAGVRTHLDFLNTFCVWRQGTYGPRIFGTKNGELFNKILYGSTPDKGILLNDTWESPRVRAERKAMPLVWTQVLPVPEQFIPRKQPEFQDAIAALDGIASDDPDTWPKQDEHLMRALRMLGGIKARGVIRLLIDEMRAAPQKMVLFYRHKMVREIFEEELKRAKIRWVFIDGSCDRVHRREAEELFQSDREFKVFLGQIESCGESLTLTAASRVEMVEPSWTPGVNAQAIARIRRHGQEHGALTATFWELPGTQDALISRVLERKQRTPATPESPEDPALDVFDPVL